VLLRPRHARPAGLVQLALPVAPERERRLVALRLAARMLRGHPRPQLITEGLLLGRQRQVHGAGSYSARGGVDRSRPPGRSAGRSGGRKLPALGLYREMPAVRSLPSRLRRLPILAG